MTTQRMLLLTVFLVSGLLTVVWGARAPKTPAPAAHDREHQHGPKDHDHKEHGHQESKEGPSHDEATHGHDEHGHDHGEEPVVRLTEAQRKELRIEVAVARAGTLETRLTLPGNIGLNTERV